MEPTCNVSSPVDARARLSYAQKRDLLGQAVAAVITTALIAAPLLTPPADGGLDSALASLPAQSFAAPVSAIAVADVMPSPLLRDIARGTESRKRIRGTRYGSMAVAPAIGVVQVREMAVATSGRQTARKPLSRRLTGWLTGNGAHPIRPFPSVAAVRQ